MARLHFKKIEDMQNLLIKNWGISSQIIVSEAKKIGLSVKILSEDNNLFFVSNKEKKVYFKSVDCWINSSFWLKVADNKELTYIIAQQNNIRVPKSTYINRSQLNSVSEEILWIQYPVISKPIDWGHGDGVSINIYDMNGLKKGLSYSFSDSWVTRVVVQEQISWEDHRIIVLNWKVIAVSKRIPPYVIGNGKDSIEQLIHIENTNPGRWGKSDHDSHMSPIKIDEELESCLAEQWYSMEYILEDWNKINVRKNANLSSWWLAIDMTDNIHLSIQQEAIKLAKEVWLKFCGIDYFCNDISKELSEWKGAIIEINATPWIRMHHFPSKWKSRNVAWLLLKELFS